MGDPLHTALMQLRRTLAIAGLGFCGASHAAAWPWPVGGSLAWTSDYVLRGISQSDNLPALQADLHLQPAPAWTIGAWASTVHLLPYTHAVEYSFYVDDRWLLTQDLSLALTASHYGYANDPRSAAYRYDELSLSLSWRDTLNASASWSPDVSLFSFPGQLHTHQQTLALDISYHQPLPWRLDGWAGLGYYSLLEQATGSYAYGSIGVARSFSRLRAEVNYFWVSNARHRAYTQGPAGGPWAFSIAWRF